MKMTPNIKVGIAGDWHGMTQVALNAITVFQGHGIKNIYHVGDFSIHTHSAGVLFLEKVNQLLLQYDMRIFVTPGNHENYDYLETIPVRDDGLQWVNTNIAAIPRGFRWMIGDTTFASLGGAASIDYLSREEGKNWWKAEKITLDDVGSLSADGLPVDVLITHEAPLGGTKVEMVKRETQEDWLSQELLYSYQSQRMVTLAVESVEPKILFHGHYHYGYIEDVAFQGFDKSIFGVRLVGMAQNGSHRNLGILNTATLDFVWVDHRNDYQKSRYPETYSPLKE